MSLQELNQSVSRKIDSLNWACDVDIQVNIRGGLQLVQLVKFLMIE